MTFNKPNLLIASEVNDNGKSKLLENLDMNLGGTRKEVRVLAQRDKQRDQFEE